MIYPTIGRVVWFHPAANDKFLAVTDGPTSDSGRQPLPALICCVHSNVEINIAGFDANGDPFSRQHVYLQQDETPAAAEGEAYAEWMPYQKQKAVEEGTAVDLAATLAGETVAVEVVSQDSHPVADEAEPQPEPGPVADEEAPAVTG